MRGRHVRHLEGTAAATAVLLLLMLMLAGWRHADSGFMFCTSIRLCRPGYGYTRPLAYSSLYRKEPKSFFLPRARSLAVSSHPTVIPARRSPLKMHPVHRQVDLGHDHRGGLCDALPGPPARLAGQSAAPRSRSAPHCAFPAVRPVTSPRRSIHVVAEGVSRLPLGRSPPRRRPPVRHDDDGHTQRARSLSEGATFCLMQALR